MTSKKNQKANQPTPEQKRQSQLQEMKKTDPAHLKQDIFRLKQQLQDLYGKKMALEKEIKDSKDQKMETIKVEERVIKGQEEEIIGLENQLNQLQGSNQTEIKAMIKQFEQEQRATLQKNRREIQQKNSEVQKLSQKVSHLQSYKARRQKYLESLKQLDSHLLEMQKKQEKDLNNIHNTHNERRLKDEKETTVEMEKIKEDEVSRLQRKMTKEQFVKRENQVMEQEILLCQGQIKVLEEECRGLKEQMDRERMQINENTLGNQASETYERSLRIIKLQGKMTKLKAYLSEQSQKLQKEYSQLDTLYTKQHQQLQSKIAKIDGWMRIKERDLKKVKACAQMVLNQRSNLQSYLLEVFYEHQDIEYKDARNINKILRFLFAKINSKKPPMTYKNFLPQSLKSISDSSIRA